MKFLSKASVVSLATIASTMLGTVPAFASESNLSATQTNVETPLSWVGEAPAEKFTVRDSANVYIAPTDLEIQNSFMNNATGKDNDLHIRYIKDGQTLSKKVGTVKNFSVELDKISGTVQDGRATPAGWSITHQATAKATTSGGVVKNMRAKETLAGSVYFSTENADGMKANVFINGQNSREITGRNFSMNIGTFDTSSGVNKFISVKDAASAGAGHELNGQGTTKFNDRFSRDTPSKVEFTFVNPHDKVENGDTVTYTTTWTLNAAPVGASV